MTQPLFLLMLASLLAGRLAAAPDAEEATERARLLHAAFADTLRVVHRDFFRKGEHLPFPSQSLSEVFGGLATNQQVELRWISPPETAMNLDHLPADAFEREALAALAAGRREHLVVADGKLRYAGLIPLENRCLKCHLQNRTTLDPRAAGLAITLPVAPP